MHVLVRYLSVRYVIAVELCVQKPTTYMYVHVHTNSQH